MAKEHTGELPVFWNMAAFMELCPAEVQNMVYQRRDEVNENYEKIKQRVASWVSNKVAQVSDPTSMGIGKVYDGDGYDGEYEEEIAAVGSHVQCPGCGGWWHFRADCVSAEKGSEGNGKGKGEKGKGKGAGEKGKGKASSSRAVARAERVPRALIAARLATRPPIAGLCAPTSSRGR
jgi:hypothetical protein